MPLLTSCNTMPSRVDADVKGLNINVYYLITSSSISLNIGEGLLIDEEGGRERKLLRVNGMIIDQVRNTGRVKYRTGHSDTQQKQRKPGIKHTRYVDRRTADRPTSGGTTQLASSGRLSEVCHRCSRHSSIIAVKKMSYSLLLVMLFISKYLTPCSCRLGGLLRTIVFDGRGAVHA